MGFDGVDTVEVILDLEKTFSIRIPDRDAERLRTADQLCDYVLKRIKIAEPSTCVACLGASAFLKARRTLGDAFGVRRREIRPGTRIERFLPSEGRWDAWRRLGDLLGVKMRGLEHPRWLSNAAAGVGLALFIALVLLMPRPDSPLHWLWFVPLMAGALAVLVGIPWLLLLALRRRCATHVPPGHETVGQVSSLLVVPRIEAVKHRKDEWTPHRVWEIVRCSIARSAGVPPAQVKKGSRIVEHFV